MVIYLVDSTLGMVIKRGGGGEGGEGGSMTVIDILIFSF
jgi:hypothetical protein